MLSERLVTTAVKLGSKKYLNLKPFDSQGSLPPVSQRHYMLYIHIPFCESLCPFCSFNRYVFDRESAISYFRSLHNELKSYKEAGFDFDSLYIGGGTPTVLPNELSDTIRLAKSLFSIKEVSAETNPNHLCDEYLGPLYGLVDRLSVGVQSFDDSLLKQMKRYDKYGSSEEIFEKIKKYAAKNVFKTLNIDMIYNFPSQTLKMLQHDIDMIRESGCNQVTFYPLMASPSVGRSLRESVGVVSYSREKEYYETICKGLVNGSKDGFSFGSAWTFNRNVDGKTTMIDEYIVDYDEYLAAGAGGMSFVSNTLLNNAFRIDSYNRLVADRGFSASGHVAFSKRDTMRYQLMMKLFGLELDLGAWKKNFSTSLMAALPMEYLFFRLSGAIVVDKDKIHLTPKGRYLLVAMMRQFFIGVNNLRDQARASAPV